MSPDYIDSMISGSRAENRRIAKALDGNKVESEFEDNTIQDDANLGHRDN